MCVCVCVCVCIYVGIYVYMRRRRRTYHCVCVYLREPAEEEAHPSFAAELVPQAVVDIACPREVLCQRERERVSECVCV